ncbi:MAG: hypothetical protein ACRYG7_12115 [Janthinobacterium lividum]
MLTRYFLVAVLTACSLLLAGPGHAASTAPAATKAALPPADTAPQLVCLTGTILTTTGQPYPGVCVFQTANHHLIAVTDAHGTFQLQVPAAPTLRLQAEYVGVGSVRMEVDGQHPQPIRIVMGR